ncbi:MAG: diaminopimelate decarboxylase [Anaerofustis stercorihominis]|nr:diaminopimelate decarboxylase [Anaerofustis stercorihominis]
MTNYIFSNHDTTALAKKYSTPLYVISQDIIEKSINEIKTAFENENIEYSINYAGKAFLNTAMAKIVNKNGINLDVVSEGELLTALAAGLPAERITFHGSNKTDREITLAINSGVGKITIDSVDEIKRVDTIARSLGKVQKVHIRVSPGVEAHTHEYIQTGKTDSKFGIPLSQAIQSAIMCKEAENINLTGIHCHIGSSIAAVDPFGVTMRVMLELFYNIRTLDIPLTDINLGGGFGVVYLKGDTRFDVNAYTKLLRKELDSYIAKSPDKTVPKIMVEPGRFIISEAGITLYTVGTVKEIPGIRKYVSVDGSLADNPRPALYQAVYDAVVANKYDEEPVECVTISGRACETDTLIKDITLPVLERGDILAVKCTGAYNYSMASNYNRLAKPAVVLLKGDKDELMVKRETVQQVMQNDVIPSWLEE